MKEHNRKLIIVNEEIDYIVKNIKAVNSLIECLDRAKDRVPSWLIKKINTKISKRIDELPGKIENWYLDLDEKELLINILPDEKYYNKNKEIGMYFGIENIDWDNIVSEYEEDGIFAYLYYYLPERKNKILKEWEENLLLKIKKKRPTMVKNNYIPNPNIEDEQYIVSAWLYDYINIDLLNTDFNLSIDRAIDFVFEFINHNIDLLTPLPE